MFRRGLLAAAGLMFALLTAQAPARADTVKVFAAASLKTALDAVSASWAAETGQHTANTYAASSSLAKQIEQGAPADLFISADRDWMAYLSDRGLTAKGTEVDLLGNELVLIAPAGATAGITIAPGFDLAAALGGGRLALADVKAVPAGKYARAALKTLGVWDSVKDHVAEAENVRAALRLVAAGEAPLGIVYRSDAGAEPKVRVLATFPENSHPRIVYPAAVLADTQNAAAADFLAYLQSPAAAAIFRRDGFSIIAR